HRPDIIVEPDRLASVPVADDPLKLADQRDLTGVDLPPRLVQAEEPSPVDLRELDQTPRPGGPLDGEGVAVDRRWVAVTPDGPGVDRLPPFLFHRIQGQEGAVRGEADLL